MTKEMIFNGYSVIKNGEHVCNILFKESVSREDLAETLKYLQVEKGDIVSFHERWFVDGEEINYGDCEHFEIEKVPQNDFMEDLREELLDDFNKLAELTRELIIHTATKLDDFEFTKDLDEKLEEIYDVLDRIEEIRDDFLPH